MKTILKFLPILLIIISCCSNAPNWLKKSNHAVSPDGNANVYQSSIAESDSIRISVLTWINTSIGTGGAGIFDLKSNSELQLEMIWESDTVVKIIYPKKARVIRMENSSYFGGRQTDFKYETKE